jgi:hypothetical protein
VPGAVTRDARNAFRCRMFMTVNAMSEPTKKFLERAAYVVFFLAAMLAVRAYKESHKPSTSPVPVSAEDAQRTRKEEEFRKRMAEFDVKEAAGHAARVKRLGEAGAKAQEDRCDEELMKAFESAVAHEKIKPSDTPDCDE